MGPTESIPSKCSLRMAKSMIPPVFKIGFIGRTLGLPKPKMPFYVLLPKNRLMLATTILVQEVQHPFSNMTEFGDPSPGSSSRLKTGNMETGVFIRTSQQWGPVTPHYSCWRFPTLPQSSLTPH
ncbi:hypothetical protein NPIL_426431 [Nephila pilipes]|uniref:Uncharacterized protein n=1 Tax=Nephila pilipes TaxID=299642 RepID=A0A8X6QB06_NEPPI|nr:hypothetical protein NPIL_426431 [Nephila pilipes]